MLQKVLGPSIKFNCFPKIFYFERSNNTTPDVMLFNTPPDVMLFQLSTKDLGTRQKNPITRNRLINTKGIYEAVLTMSLAFKTKFSVEVKVRLASNVR